MQPFAFTIHTTKIIQDSSCLYGGVLYFAPPGPAQVRSCWLCWMLGLPGSTHPAACPDGGDCIQLQWRWRCHMGCPFNP